MLLIADSGATKCEWCIVNDDEENKTVFTTGISPYFLNAAQIAELLEKELTPALPNAEVDKVYFYGTGLGNPDNVKIICNAFAGVFPDAKVKADTDLLAAARALCGNEKGIACILGTGSNSCYYDGKKIMKNIPSLGYVLGDEGSGAQLGKKVLQFYLSNIFDEDLKARFDAMFVTTQMEILENLYKKPFPNRYLAGFAIFLAQNRGYEMVENILEEVFNEFFFKHILTYEKSRTLPVNFTGSIAFGFKDVLQELCKVYGFRLGRLLKNPMQGLVKYHTGVAEKRIEE